MIQKSPQKDTVGHALSPRSECSIEEARDHLAVVLQQTHRIDDPITLEHIQKAHAIVQNVTRTSPAMQSRSRLADDLERLCCAETEGKFFNCVTDHIGEIIAALRGASSDQHQVTT